MIYPPTPTKIQQAVDLLRAGQLVAFPTETVYGLGADASNSQAVAKIFAAKNRPRNHPVIVHLGDISQLSHWIKATITDDIEKLATNFWPGPMTLILPCADHVSTHVTGNQPSIGIRIPNHPVALQLLQAFGGGIAAPSANRFGHVSPTTADHVQSELQEKVAMILDGGPCSLGIESTIIDLTSASPQIVRPGMITITQIQTVLGRSIIDHSTNDLLRAPGKLIKHYSPQTPLSIIKSAELKALATNLANTGKNIAVIAISNFSFDDKNIHSVHLDHDPHLYAHHLYAVLRELDEQNYDALLLEEVPQHEDWLAIWDRLIKASTR